MHRGLELVVARHRPGAVALARLQLGRISGVHLQIVGVAGREVGELRQAVAHRHLGSARGDRRGVLLRPQARDRRGGAGLVEMREHRVQLAVDELADVDRAVLRHVIDRLDEGAQARLRRQGVDRLGDAGGRRRVRLDAERRALHALDRRDGRRVRVMGEQPPRAPERQVHAGMQDGAGGDVAQRVAGLVVAPREVLHAGVDRHVRQVVERALGDQLGATPGGVGHPAERADRLGASPEVDRAGHRLAEAAGAEHGRQASRIEQRAAEGGGEVGQRLRIGSGEDVVAGALLQRHLRAEGGVGLPGRLVEAQIAVDAVALVQRLRIERPAGVRGIAAVRHVVDHVGAELHRAPAEVAERRGERRAGPHILRHRRRLHRRLEAVRIGRGGEAAAEGHQPPPCRCRKAWSSTMGT